MKILPKNKLQANRIKRLLLATSLYVFFFALVILAQLAGLYQTSLGVLAALTFACFIVQACFYLFMRKGYNLRLKDPSLTLPQIFAGMWWTTLVLFLIEDLDSVGLVLYCLLSLFGVFRLNFREHLFTAIGAVVCYLMVVSYHTLSGSSSLSSHILQLITLAVAMCWLLVFANFVRSIRDGLKLKETELQVVHQEYESELAERRQAVQALRESEHRYRAIFEQAGDAIALVEAETGSLVEFNDHAHKNLGYSREEFSKLSALDLHAKENITSMRDRRREILEKGEVTYETEHITKNGAYRNMIISCRAICIGGKYYFLSIGHDHTKYHQMEQELKAYQHQLEERVRDRTEELAKSQEVLRGIMDNIPTAIFWKDADLHYRGCNSVFAQANGLEHPSRVVGLTDFDLPCTLEEAQLYRRTDRLVLDTNKPLLHEVVSQEMPDGTIFWSDTCKMPLHDGSGNVIGVLGTYEDITKRKEAELNLKKSKELAEAANHGKSVFLANISHELRTPLNGILGYAGLGLEISKDGDREDPNTQELLNCFNRINNCGVTLLTLLNELLDLAKLESGKMLFDFKPTNIAELAQQILEEFGFQANQKNITITLINRIKDKGSDLPLDPGKMGQVLRNLLSNALKFSPEQGRIRILCMAEPHTESTLIHVIDEGEGVPEGELESIFEKFIQSSKSEPASGGTGLGLAICREIINAHKGKIWAQNNPDGGACFCLQLPWSRQRNKQDKGQPINKQSVVYPL